MRRSNDVFFFTLIDLLLQVLFFGLVLFVVGQAAIKVVLDKAGVSNLAELTDALTRMVPVERLTAAQTFIENNGGRAYIEKSVQIVRAAGGPERAARLKSELDEAHGRIKTLEGERWGAPSCVPMVNGRPPAVARVVVRDQSITIESPTPEFLRLLEAHRLAIDEVRTLSPAAFRTTFARVVSSEPGCRYFLGAEVKTEYLAPMRAVWSAFKTI